ncbi:MAG: D-alanyl-D-alanine carboxypeptidase [Treponema sp.]|jgi:D-alanyl-D-alanine carboxypeptidase (penicillin-binding protein 5/6)|nr:D-alanyl-D-alanine carboxypeptidase [Treponema sp.]
MKIIMAGAGACPLRFRRTRACPAARWIPGLLLCFHILYSGAAFAQVTSKLLKPGSPAPAIASRAALLLDAETGTVLYEKNADEAIPPASLTKLMTAHIALREAAAGSISLDESLQPPRESWAINQPPRSSLMFLAAGQQVSLRELLLGLAIPSGNDAAVAVALRLAPTVADFVDIMNSEAKRLGFQVTHFVEPSGISEFNLTTAREFAYFCQYYLSLYPQSLQEFHSVREFAYPKPENVAERYRERPGTIVQYNHNNLLKDFPGVDGLKTGYIDEAGYNIALTALQEGTRFILVLLGAPTVRGGDKMRDEDGRNLLTWAFEQYRTIRPIIPDPEPVKLWKGNQREVRLVSAETPDFTGPRDRGQQLYLSAEITDPLIAPLAAGQTLGTLVISDDLGELHRIPLLAAEDYEEGGFFRRLWDSVQLFFRSLGRER